MQQKLKTIVSTNSGLQAPASKGNAIWYYVCLCAGDVFRIEQIIHDSVYMGITAYVQVSLADQPNYPYFSNINVPLLS